MVSRGISIHIENLPRIIRTVYLSTGMNYASLGMGEHGMVTAIFLT
jgi:hypothetical protein